MSEFSRRVDIEIIKSEPFTSDEWLALHPGRDVDDTVIAYNRYLARFQPYRWHAKSTGNGEIVARSESYFNLADCIENIELNYGDDTTVYRMPIFGEDRHEVVLRFGKTDREHQAATQITTAEQLAALPPESIIKTHGGTVACRHYDGVHGVVFGDDRPLAWPSALVSELPAVVLWHPERVV